ncbi:MAG: hypothetical protein M1515_02750 [Candidatus Thermoplasmatota archaeon]|jgi:energy-coupling factor transporter transmembrane protein EcfT|nr:hypothetical protein [Candidatus Thermoplasmatota archaeon]
MSADERKKDRTMLIPSFVTHDSQVLIHRINASVVTVGLFGIFCLIIAGSIVQSIGAALGIYRFLAIAPNPFSVFNVSLDAMIPLFSIMIFRRWSDGDQR